MANYVTATPNQRQAWSIKYTSEYVRESEFYPYMGKADNAIIRTDKQLTGERGVMIHFDYFQKLSGAGVTNGGTLMGSEEALNNYSTGVRVSGSSNAVKIRESETLKTEIDIANVARSSLKNWSSENLRNDLTTALQSVVIPGGTDANGYLEDTYKSYASASAADRNLWGQNNTDRILFGNAKSNYNATHATALGNITSGMTLSAGVLGLAKRMAQASSPMKITPYKSDTTAGREYYVLFVGPEGFRDLANDADIKAANTYARAREMESNPIFQGGDLEYGGVIIRQVVSMPLLTGTPGAGGTVYVGHAQLCGCNSAAVAWSRLPEPRIQSWDYGQENNVGIVEYRGQSKMSAAGKQTGMVSIFHAATPDT